MNQKQQQKKATISAKQYAESQTRADAINALLKTEGWQYIIVFMNSRIEQMKTEAIQGYPDQEQEIFSQDENGRLVPTGMKQIISGAQKQAVASGMYKFYEELMQTIQAWLQDPENMRNGVKNGKVEIEGFNVYNKTKTKGGEL